MAKEAKTKVPTAQLAAFGIGAASESQHIGFGEQRKKQGNKLTRLSSRIFPYVQIGMSKDVLIPMDRIL